MTLTEVFLLHHLQYLAPWGRRRFPQGESFTSNLFILFSSCIVSLVLFCLPLLEKHKKISFLFSSSLVALFSLNMLLPQFMFKELSIVSGAIIGRENIDDFFNHVSKHDDIDDKSIVDLAPNYEIAAASLVHMLEARFVNLNPMMQILFLKLKEEKDPKPNHGTRS